MTRCSYYAGYRMSDGTYVDPYCDAHEDDSEDYE